MQMAGGWIGVDLDKTLAYCDEYKGTDIIGEPIPLMFDRVKELIQSGQIVKIFTARAETEAGKLKVSRWLESHGIGGLEVTNVKDSLMIHLYDDRASRVIANTGVIVESIVQPNQTATISQDQSRKAMKFTLDTQKNTMEGANRPDIGWIAFLWGNAGTAPLFADGDGLARIIAKQDFEKKYLPGEQSGRDKCMRLVDIVTRGYIKRKYGPTSRPKIDFSWQGEVATVSWEPARKTWYLSAWREDWGGILESAQHPILEDSGDKKDLKKERQKIIAKIKKAGDSGKKTEIFQNANLSKADSELLVRDMVLTVPKGYYKLHDREYGTNLVDTIYEMYGWMPSMFVSEAMLLGLQAAYPKKVYASFTLGLDAIEIKDEFKSETGDTLNQHISKREDPWYGDKNGPGDHLGDIIAGRVGPDWPEPHEVMADYPELKNDTPPHASTDEASATRGVSFSEDQPWADSIQSATSFQDIADVFKNEFGVYLEDMQG